MNGFQPLGNKRFPIEEQRGLPSSPESIWNVGMGWMRSDQRLKPAELSILSRREQPDSMTDFIPDPAEDSRIRRFRGIIKQPMQRHWPSDGDRSNLAGPFDLSAAHALTCSRHWASLKCCSGEGILQGVPTAQTPGIQGSAVPIQGSICVINRQPGELRNQV